MLICKSTLQVYICAALRAQKGGENHPTITPFMIDIVNFFVEIKLNLSIITPSLSCHPYI